jgi:O-methyltransferase involved in polyketide biosynthesis
MEKNLNWRFWMNKEFKKNTVQYTLCIPLWGRMLAAKKYTDLFPDHGAERILRELNVDLSKSKLYRLEYAYLNCAVRQYDFSCEIGRYLEDHPHAAVCELGAGLSTLREQLKNESNPWYNLDMPDVIALREKHIPAGSNETNIACDLNDFSWFDAINFKPQDGIVFIGGGLFYYFEKEQVKRLFSAMSKKFPGGIITFDATNAMGLRGVNKEVKLAGNATKSYFSLENPKSEIESWSPNLTQVSEKDYMRGYLRDTSQFGFITQVAMRITTWTHTSFIVHVEFKSASKRPAI